MRTNLRIPDEDIRIGKYFKVEEGTLTNAITKNGSRKHEQMLTIGDVLFRYVYF